LTTGDAQWVSDNAVWYVMVKDTRGCCKGNPNWGEGLEWTLFETKNLKANPPKGYVDSCLGRPTPAKQTGWVYIQG